MKKPSTATIKQKAKTVKVKSKTDAKVVTSKIRKSADIKTVTEKTVTKTNASFSKTLAKLRKQYNQGEVDLAYCKEVYTAMLTSTNKLIGVCERQIYKDPKSIGRSAYSYNALCSQSREIMHDLAAMQMQAGTAEKITGMVQGSISNIVQSLVELNSIYRSQVSGRVSDKKIKAKIQEDFNLQLKQVASVLNEHYKGLIQSIENYYSPASSGKK